MPILKNKTIAVDNPALIPELQRSGANLRFVDDERLLRRIRLQKSNAELVLMRYAAAENSCGGNGSGKNGKRGRHVPGHENSIR
jgi:hypothetical protein